jgi:hypothetical protein
MPVFVRLMYITGYCKFYWQQKQKWAMCELDMCHVKVTFGGYIALLTHSTATSNGQNKILAFGVHMHENKEEWRHFFDFCNLHYPGIKHLVNDQDKGLKSIEVQAKMTCPTLTTSHCILHIVRNELVAVN